MTIRSSRCLLGGAAAFLALSAMLLSGAGSPGRFRVLYSFGGNPDGEYPATDLVIDRAGNLYGMTVLGGDLGSGTVFRLSRSNGGWTETVLYSFTSVADGGQPYGGVTLDDEGNLYGTAVVGGTGGTCVEAGCGVVWKLANTAGTWSQEVIYNFTGGDDGYGPGGPVVFDDLGNLYGMTPTGGAYGLGVVYRLSPDGRGEWTQTVLHAFTGGEDGGTGSAGRLLIVDGRIFGVATVGGAHGAGTVFRLTQAANGTWTLKTIYSFKGEPDGSFPYGGLVRDAHGNLYGTTYYGGAHGDGTVYKLAYKNGRWRERVLYSFTGRADGAYPISNLVFDKKGNLYGTTSEDGAAGCNCGTIFKLSMSPLGTQRAKVRAIHQFHGPDGAYSYNGLVADSKGNFYGATVQGGDDDDGVIYQFRP